MQNVGGTRDSSPGQSHSPPLGSKGGNMGPPLNVMQQELMQSIPEVRMELKNGAE